MLHPHGWARVLAIVLLAAAAPAAPAGILVHGSAGHAWLPFTTPSEGGNPYWDQHSLDGSQYNVGYYLTRTGGYAAPATLGKDSPALPADQLQYWGSSSSPHQADPLQTFQAQGAVPVTLHLTFAGNHNINEFGYYLVGSPATLHPLFAGGEYYGTGPNYPVTASFTPTGEFGFYLKTGSKTYYSESSLNPADDLINGQDPHQHFAVFRETASGRLWIGVEDLKGLNATEQAGDFNDIIVSIHEAPEPAGILLAGWGMLGVLAWLRGSRAISAPSSPPRTGGRWRSGRR